MVAASYLYPPTVGKINETVYGKANGTITGTDDTMEYRKDNETTYTLVTDVSITGLGMGTYYIRYAEADGKKASLDTKVVIDADQKLSVTFPTEIECNTYGYKIKDVTDASVNVRIDKNYTFTLVLVDGKPAGDGSMKVYLDEESANPLEPTVIGNEYTFTIPNVQADHTIKVAGVEHYTDELTVSPVTFSRDYKETKPEGEALIITNNGTRKGMIASVTIGGTDESKFEAITVHSTAVPVNGTLETYKIQPKAKIDTGIYHATITVTYYKDAAKTDNSGTTTADITYTVNSKELTEGEVKLSKTTMYYTTGELKPVLVDKEGNTIAAGEYAAIYHNNVAIGDNATVEITNIPGGNYTVPNKTYTFSIQYLPTEAAVSLSGTKADGFDWYKDNVTVKAPTGYQLSTETISSATIWKDSVTVSTEGTTELKYHLKRTSDGTITSEKTATVKVDKAAPSDLTIHLEENQWKNFISAITFNLIYKDNKNMTLTATDAASEVTIYYYISTSELSLDEVKGNVLWKRYSSKFGIQEGKNIVYTKAVDEAGNVIYSSSQGIIKDTGKPVITGISNGGKYCGQDVTFTVSDAYIDGVVVKVNDVAVTLINGTYTIPKADGTYSITATDQAGNVSDPNTISLQVNHSYDSGVVTTPAKMTRNGVKTFTCTHCGHTYTEVIPMMGMPAPTGNPDTDNENLKKFIEEAADKAGLEELQKKAENDRAQNALEDLAKTPLPDQGSITSDNKDELDKQLDRINDILKDENLEDDKKQKLNDEKTQL